MSSNDQDLFKEMMDDVTPIKREATTRQRVKPEQTPGVKLRRAAAQKELAENRNGLASEEHVPLVKPWDELSFKRDGVQHGVFKNMRLGKYQIDARLDLHHHTVEQARKAVLGFILDCRELDLRCVLITHGKGEMREKPALLKSCVNCWLKELGQVLAFHSAQAVHGGLGATYVMLRKSDKKRDENREVFQTRRKGIS